MKKTNKSKDAFVLLIALAFVSLLALGSTFLLTVSSQKAYTELRRTQTEMARIIAESGVHISIAAILRGEKSVVSDFDPIEIGDGTATIVIEESGDASLSSTDSSEKYYDLTSTATYGKQKATVQVLLRLTGDDGDSDGDEYFDGSVFCGGNLTMAGGVSINGGVVHANGTISINNGARLNAATVSSCSGINQLGGGVYITGNVAVPQKPQVAYGTLTTFIGGSVTVDPDMSGKKKIAWINTDPFRLLAVEKDISWPINGKFPSTYTFTDSYISEEEQSGISISGKGKTTSNEKLVYFGGNGTVAPDGGVLWVEGNVTFSEGCKVKGCVIATGTITVEGGTTHEPVNSDSKIPSFMSLDGDVNINAGCHVYGLVYADKGNINVTGAGTIHGAYLARNGNFSCTQGGSVTARGSLPTGPNKEDVTMPNAGNSTVTIERWFK